MSEKKKKYSVQNKAMDEALEQMLSAIVKTACAQFEEEEVRVDAMVKMCDEFMLSTIRNLITAYFEAMTATILDMKKEAKKP